NPHHPRFLTTSSSAVSCERWMQATIREQPKADISASSKSAISLPVYELENAIIRHTKAQCRNGLQSNEPAGQIITYPLLRPCPNAFSSKKTNNVRSPHVCVTKPRSIASLV